ncbi:HK97 gp10 family phage protein [Liquorilactobacillus mali]|uniref:HK97 gp10 family phage protein n=1 Tax=Liquorilactobacillus mali TaxID=1618 RepID=A0A0R2FTB0_9LACO|nr:HK97-gp10 family putative phage morphogenesis protein [Liquorilactobacillus mali]KRN31634.1 hypothetical protein IV36_GL001758 [Liquorilactobacillus mali]MDN7145149.1 HK97 gp10 family phage protein [Liquorilactobacillus mali]
MSDNGFEDLARQLKQIDIGKSVVKSSLEEAADFYLQKLRPNVPSWGSGHHAKDDLSVKINEDGVQVVFGEKSYYWYFVENGTKKQRAQHFARNTLEQNRSKIEQIMLKKIESELR